MNSSTSSSNPDGTAAFVPRTRKARRYLGLGFLFALVLIAASEVFIARNVRVYGYSEGYMGQIAQVDYAFEKADADQIRVAVFGDSMGIDALRPEYLGADLGMPSSAIFNFSLSGGYPFEVSHMYRQHIDAMPNVKTVIIDVNEFWLNTDHPEKAPMFRWYAKLGDRLRVMNRDNYGELLVGWMDKFYDMRDMWQLMARKYRGHKLYKEIPYYPGGMPAVKWSPPEDRTQAYAEDTAKRWMENYRLDGIEWDAFQGMVEDLRSRGIDVYIVQLPRTDMLERELGKRFPEEQKQYRDKVAALAKRTGAVFEIMSNDGYAGKDFRDVNHLLPSGARKASRQVAGRIERLFRASLFETS